MRRNSTASISAVPIDRDEVGLPGPTSERWNSAATVFELAGVATLDCCGLPVELECGCDPYEVAEFTADAARVFARPIMCRPASQWGS